MKTTVASPYIDPHRRILVTSDIHGHAAWLKNALTAADFGGDDLLIVVGDLVEKGPDSLGTVRASEDQAASADSFNIHWGDCNIRVLETEGDCTLVEHIRTGRRLWAPTDYLYADGTQWGDVTDYRLPVAAGDTLSLLKTTARGYIVKKDGVVGWYCGSIELLSQKQ